LVIRSSGECLLRCKNVKPVGVKLLILSRSENVATLSIENPKYGWIKWRS
jgi:hypothetical protein